jgi:hypothetical protein
MRRHVLSTPHTNITLCVNGVEAGDDRMPDKEGKIHTGVSGGMFGGVVQGSALVSNNF